MKLRRFVFTHCLHVHPHRVGSANGGRDRLEDGLKALSYSLAMAKHEDAAWVFAGDLKQPHTFWPQQALNGIHATFAAYPTVLKILVPGNHDGVEGEWGSGLAPFKAVANVIETPTFIDGVAFWPYGTRNWDQFEGFADDAIKAKVRLLVAHLFVQGVALGVDDTRLPGKGVTLDALRIDRPFTLALLGDIHKGQRCTRTHDPARRLWQTGWEGNGAVWRMGEMAACYAGDPYQQNWGERDDGAKGVLLVDRHKETIEFRQIGAPAFVLHDWTRRVLPPSSTGIRASIRAWLREGRVGPQDIVRVRLPQDWLSNREVSEVLTESEQGGAQRTFRVIPVPRPSTETRSELSASMSLDELLAAYVDAKTPPVGVSPAKALEVLRKLA